MRMGERYVCRSEDRRTAVRDHPVLTGIDYLEVLDADAPPGSPRQQTLLVHCFKPVPALRAENVLIEGGVRITPVRARWAFAVPAVPAARASQAERDLFAAIPDAERVLVIRTDVAGDFATYRLANGPS